MSNQMTTRFPTKHDFADAMCDHVQADRSIAVLAYVESDSFGTVGTYVVCRDCFKEKEEAEKQERIRGKCEDCGEAVKMADSIGWKWYDFYAAQGDEPLCICKACVDKSRHQSRVSADSTERQLEEGQSVLNRERYRSYTSNDW